MSLDEYVKRLTSLRVGKVGTHERPHKPALLLALISLVESGALRENRVQYEPELFALFRRYFDVARASDDAVNMLDPFWRLQTDGVLVHEAKAGYEKVVECQTGAPSAGHLHDMTTGSCIPSELFDLLLEPESRERLRLAIIERYFPALGMQILEVARQERAIGEYERVLEERAGEQKDRAATPEEAIRDQAFRRVVRRAYDYRCAACGLRVMVDDVVLVDAAHLIPFAITQDDDPRNGIALCRNHHWAMDKQLLAPTTRLLWAVSPCLDDRIEGQCDLIGLRERAIILPKCSDFHPKKESLRWREKRLRAG